MGGWFCVRAQKMVGHYVGNKSIEANIQHMTEVREHRHQTEEPLGTWSRRGEGHFHKSFCASC